MMEEMCLNPALYGGKFQKIYIFAPNKMPTLVCNENENWWRELDVDKIIELITRFAETNPNGHILFLIDDSIMPIKELGNNRKFVGLLYNRRHYLEKGTVSFMISTQKYKTCPPRLRPVLTGLLVWSQRGNDMDHIFSECITSRNPRNVTERLIEEHWASNKHNFIYINLENTEIWLNFRAKIQ